MASLKDLFTSQDTGNYAVTAAVHPTSRVSSSERINISSCPALIYPRKAIEFAFIDAKHVKDGRPTQRALDAVDWIKGETDWTKLEIEQRMEVWSQPAPPEDIRKEFVGTFDWCCHYLGHDPERVRVAGLPPTSSNLTHGNPTEGGLPSVYSVWQAKRNRQRSGVASFVNACSI